MSKEKRRHHTPEQKLTVVRRGGQCRNVEERASCQPATGSREGGVLLAGFSERKFGTRPRSLALRGAERASRIPFPAGAARGTQRWANLAAGGDVARLRSRHERLVPLARPVPERTRARRRTIGSPARVPPSPRRRRPTLQRACTPLQSARPGSVREHRATRSAEQAPDCRCSRRTPERFADVRPR